MQALTNLNVQLVEPEQLKSLFDNKDDEAHRHNIYVVPFKTHHLVRWTHDYDKPVQSKDYYQDPGKFTPIFHTKYLPYISVLINDIYWEQKFPRYISNT